MRMKMRTMRRMTRKGRGVRRRTLTLPQLPHPDTQSHLASTLLKPPLACTHFRPPTPIHVLTDPAPPPGPHLA